MKGENYESFVDYLDCGNYRAHNDREIGDYVCSGFEDIYNKIIPFFNKYPILGVKSQDLLIELKQLSI